MCVYYCSTYYKAVRVGGGGQARPCHWDRLDPVTGTGSTLSLGQARPAHGRIVLGTKDALLNSQKKRVTCQSLKGVWAKGSEPDAFDYLFLPFCFFVCVCVCFANSAVLHVSQDSADPPPHLSPLLLVSQDLLLVSRDSVHVDCEEGVCV